MPKFPAEIPILLDGRPVEQITAFLFDQGGHDDPYVLLANAGKSFIGSYVLGMGFTFDDTQPKATPISEMHWLIAKDPRNAERIFPYIGGEEVNSSPTHAHNRYVINFGEMSEEEARKNYPDLMAIVEEKVKPERIALPPKNNWNRTVAKKWWLFGADRKELQVAIQGLPRVLVICRHQPQWSVACLPSSSVFAESLIVIPLETIASFAILQSRIHENWARFFGSSLEDRLRYTPSDCFETFPFPASWDSNPTLETIGQTYYEFRAALMVEHNEGLTDTYNRFHDPKENNSKILYLRQLHDEMDRAVLAAYGWADVDTTCGFVLDYLDLDEDAEIPVTIQEQIARGDLYFATAAAACEFEGQLRMKRKLPWRYKWPQVTHDLVLARLLQLNQERHEAEVIGGVKAIKSPTKKSRKSQASDTPLLDLV